MDIIQQPFTDEIKKKVYDGFSRHAIQMTGHDEKFDTIAFVAMEGETFVGAVTCERFWGALHIKHVFVEDGFRKQGIASSLMMAAFTYAKANKCPFAFVETMSFQALDFYEKLGFVLEYSRQGYAHKTAFHYLRKDL